MDAKAPVNDETAKEINGLFLDLIFPPEACTVPPRVPASQKSGNTRRVIVFSREISGSSESLLTDCVRENPKGSVYKSAE